MWFVSVLEGDTKLMIPVPTPHKQRVYRVIFIAVKLKIISFPLNSIPFIVPSKHLNLSPLASLFPPIATPFHRPIS